MYFILKFSIFFSSNDNLYLGKKLRKKVDKKWEKMASVGFEPLTPQSINQWIGN